jgi:hypothetical protein
MGEVCPPGSLVKTLKPNPVAKKEQEPGRRFLEQGCKLLQRFPLLPILLD